MNSGNHPTKDSLSETTCEWFDDALQEEWHKKYLPMILDPMNDEYYPWLSFVLSKASNVPSEGGITNSYVLLLYFTCARLVNLQNK